MAAGQTPAVTTRPQDASAEQPGPKAAGVGGKPSARVLNGLSPEMQAAVNALAALEFTDTKGRKHAIGHAMALVIITKAEGTLRERSEAPAK